MGTGAELDELRPSIVGKKNAARGRMEGMQAQTMAVLTSATLQLSEGTLVSKGHDVSNLAMDAWRRR